MMTASGRTYRVFTRKHLDEIGKLRSLDAERVIDMKAVAAVLPFRVNSYVIDELIRWDDGDADPIFQLTFPQRGMLEETDFRHMRDLVANEAPEAEVLEAARAIQHRLNPHPAGQLDLNVPSLDGEPVGGMQHKYSETALFFPSAGQTCHAYCSYCFRWAQFVGMDEFKFANRESENLVAYLAKHPEVTDVLFTGGDPMVMKTKILERYIEPLLQMPGDRPQSIRIGTKAPAWWPQRFVTNNDADDMLRLFERVVASGRHLALMAHFSHPRELESDVAQEAIRRIRSTGAVVRCQAPLIRHVNDDAQAWAEMWDHQVRLGAVPYYMFVERDTGAQRYFEVPLARAYEIFTEAWTSVSGLARTARGPSMSATPGKVLVDGIAEIRGEKVFVLKLIQARDASLANQVFFAKFDESATWLDDLRPAFGARRFPSKPPRTTTGPPIRRSASSPAQAESSPAQAEIRRWRPGDYGSPDCGFRDPGTILGSPFPGPHHG